MALLVHLPGLDQSPWVERFRRALDGYPVYAEGDAVPRSEIRYVFAWKPAPDAFEGLDSLRAIFSLGAGVDALLTHPNLPDVPIVRFVDADMTQSMSDYVIAQVTMHHRLISRYQAHQRAKVWTQLYPPPATAIAVGVMGLGVLGEDAARKLGMLGFTVNGWSRSRKSIDGVETFAGAEAFADFLAATDILVNLLPLTEETQGILNMATFKGLRRGKLPGGPVVVNAARGRHQIEADLVEALKDGTLGAASVDVFEVEPLPKQSPLWALDNCYITPHIAAVSNEANGVRYFSDMLRAHERGAPLTNLVDRERGY
ncbi:2-hydroxyacid dehydrogenase [Pelagibacterium xiamenense]|uniref:2-hydroxyacid dehydrogenase n=1 Tax=Pelagibacterium xiamenense TaxID=2901140 RepID=UPI001E404C1F|nr:glyoxylate/hydroxypyruvate reductase A [Pelagibacterium xiamenense]MCD7058879.1 glyoxylate/hydroxypyruvate reductase A [Pelagibacterium xiamenense]